MGIDGDLRDLAASHFVGALYFQRHRSRRSLKSFRQLGLNEAGCDLLMNLDDPLAEQVLDQMNESGGELESE